MIVTSNLYERLKHGLPPLNFYQGCFSRMDYEQPDTCCIFAGQITAGMYKFLYLLFLLISYRMQAQTNSSIPGEYFLVNIMETACGLKLSADSSFQFGFSQGALDRYGQGKWTVKNGQVLLTGAAAPGPDFKLLHQSQTGKNIRIKIASENAFARQHVYCKINGAHQQQESTTNADGIAIFKPQQIDSIELIFEFCPEKKATFYIKDKPANDFEFAFEEWMMEIFFKQFVLDIKEEGLAGANPVLSGNDFFYQKQH